MKKYKFITNPGLAELNSVYMKYRTVCREIGLREAAAVYAEQFVRNCVWAKYKSEEQALYLNEEQMSDINTAMCNSIYSGDARHALQAIQRCTRESMKQVLDDNPMHVSLIVFPLQEKDIYTIAATACCRTMLFARYANRQQERGSRRLEDALIFYKKIEEESKKDIQTLADIMYRSVNALTAGDFNGFYETGQNWSLC